MRVSWFSVSCYLWFLRGLLGQNNNGEDSTVVLKNCTRVSQKTVTVMRTKLVHTRSETCTLVWLSVIRRCRNITRIRSVTEIFTRLICVEENTCCGDYIENGSGSCVRGRMNNSDSTLFTSACNCTEEYCFESVEGQCTSIPNCICKSEGTLNCDVKRKTCNCQNEFKEAACSATNSTNAPEIHGLMTTFCNCKEGETFCKPQTKSCVCQLGWSGDHCEHHIPFVEAKSLTSVPVIAGSVGGVVIVIALVASVLIWYRHKGEKGSSKAKSSKNGVDEHSKNTSHLYESAHTYSNTTVTYDSYSEYSTIS